MKCHRIPVFPIAAERGDTARHRAEAWRFDRRGAFRSWPNLMRGPLAAHALPSVGRSLPSQAPSERLRFSPLERFSIRLNRARPTVMPANAGIQGLHDVRFNVLATRRAAAPGSPLSRRVRGDDNEGFNLIGITALKRPWSRFRRASRAEASKQCSRVLTLPWRLAPDSSL